MKFNIFILLLSIFVPSLSFEENEFSDGILVKTRTGRETGASSSGTKEIVENSVDLLTGLFKLISVKGKIESLENVIKAWRTQLKEEEDELSELEEKMKELTKRENSLRDRLKNDKFYLENILAKEKAKQGFFSSLCSAGNKFLCITGNMAKFSLKFNIEYQSQEIVKVYMDPHKKLPILENQYDSLNTLLDMLDKEIDSLKNKYKAKQELVQRLEDIFRYGYTVTAVAQGGGMPFKKNEYSFNRKKKQFEVYVKCKTRWDAYDAALNHGSNGYFNFPIYNRIHDDEDPDQFRHYHLGRNGKRENDKQGGKQCNFHYTYGYNTHKAVSRKQDGCDPVPKNIC